MLITESNIDLLVEETLKTKGICQKFIADGLKVEQKADTTLVTNLDKHLDKHFTNVIRNILKDDSLIISEEDISAGAVYEDVKDGQGFWSIDPIDSTNTLVQGGDHFCVNIAYIENNIPVFGIIYAPLLDTIWYGSLKFGAYKITDSKKTQIFARIPPKQGAVLMSSEEQITTPEFLEKYNIKKEIKLPSAIKFTYIAEGIADFYTRKRNKACDWDISSGHAIILAAGGTLIYTNQQENFQYGIKPYLAPALLAKGATTNV